MTTKEQFRVAIQYGDDNGYIEYNPANKSIFVALADAEKKREVEAYLTQQQVILTEGSTLTDFKPFEIVAIDNLDNFKLALTRLWNTTNVLVAWSRPV